MKKRLMSPLNQPAKDSPSVHAPEAAKRVMRKPDLLATFPKHSSESLLGEILDLNRDAAKVQSIAPGDWALRDKRCAVAFDFELAENLPESVAQIYQAVHQLTKATHCVILLADEQTGLYALLEDLQTPGGKVHELSGPNDALLQSRLDGSIVKACFLLENGQTGLVAITGHSQQQPLLDLLCPYLANKLSRFMRLRQSQALPFVQGVVLELCSKLVSAVDREGIITAVLNILTRRLSFDACQYVGLNPETGLGEVLYEARNTGDSCKISSYSHAGLENKRRKIKEFSNLVGLLSSMARNRFYLHLNGKKLGDKSLGDIFGIRNIQSALLLPVMDVATGQIQGTFNLFHTSDAVIGSESREVSQEAVQLASQAINRAIVLEKALAMAFSDELTGLINRRGYYQRFEAEIERARRHQTPLCVALVDVDHFKRFNDTYGHLSGDLVLKALAEKFTQNLRRSDVICRFGGEEFAILLPDTSLKSSVELMERVRQSVEKMELIDFTGESLKVTISIGVAAVNTLPKASPHHSEVSDTLALADEQLYKAKDNGRNRVCFIPEQREDSISQAG
jgi:diguanylate cyclase (GGDEF)-like protein